MLGKKILQLKKKHTGMNKILKIQELIHEKKKKHLSLVCSYVIKNTKQLLARVYPGLLLVSYLITKHVKFNKMSMRPTPLFSCSDKN